MHSKLSVLLVLLLHYTAAYTFTTYTLKRERASASARRPITRLQADCDSSDDPVPKISDDEWRSFRAKLVSNEEGKVDANSASPSLEQYQYAYDAKTSIETGSIIAAYTPPSSPNAPPGGGSFGLRQNYFHKSVILLLSHDRKRFTKGIILNRPIERTVTYANLTWTCSYGGDVQCFDSVNLFPSFVCLHTLRSPEAQRISIPITGVISWTTIEAASILVKEGKGVTQDDFRVYCGYAGWGKDQLEGELLRGKSWYSVSADSKFLEDEIIGVGCENGCYEEDIRNGGVGMWERLMDLLGKREEKEESRGGFGDLMLKEWTILELRRNSERIFTVGGGTPLSPPTFIDTTTASTKEILKDPLAERIIKASNDLANNRFVGAGSVVLASESRQSTGRPPFILNSQHFHKSVVLIIQDDSAVSVGLLLNRISAASIELTIGGSKVRKAIHFGGEFQMKATDTYKGLLWIHASKSMYKKGCGSPIGMQKNFFSVSSEAAIGAIKNGTGMLDDFIVVSGVSVWTKGEVR